MQTKKHDQQVDKVPKIPLKIVLPIVFTALIIALMAFSPVLLQTYEDLLPPPTITFSEPIKDTPVVYSENYTIQGFIQPEKATLLVDGQEFATDNGKFVLEKRLDFGLNEIEFDVSYKNKKTHVDFFVKREITDEENPHFSIEGELPTTVSVPTIEIKGKVDSGFTQITIDEKPFELKEREFSYVKELQPGNNFILIKSNNTKSGLKFEKTIYVFRKITAEEQKKIIEEATRVNPLSELKVHEKGIANKVTFDFDEYGYYRYYESKKDERIIFVKATATRSFPLLAAWRIKEDQTIESVYLFPEYQNRKYSDRLSGQSGIDNDFDYRDSVKLVFQGRISKDLSNQTWFISENAPFSIQDVSSYRVLARIN